MPIKDYTNMRQDLHEAINTAIRTNDGDILGITGWVLIAETTLANKRELLAISGDVVGDRDVPPWTLKGWLGEVLEEVWFYFGFKDDEEDED